MERVLDIYNSGQVYPAWIMPQRNFVQAKKNTPKSKSKAEGKKKRQPYLTNTQYFIKYLLDAGYSKQEISEKLFFTPTVDITPLIEDHMILGEAAFRRLLSFFCRVSLNL